jgi:ATP-dependent protease ClpP protease subunit
MIRPRGVGIVKMEIADDIVAETADMVASAVAEYPDHEIEFTLAAPGGDWHASATIFDALCNHTRRVTAIIERAASGGALIALAADVRVLHPHGFFYLHMPRGPYAKAVLDAIAAKKASLMASRLPHMPAARLRRMMEATTTIDAERALHYGLATDVPGLPKPQHVTVFL